MSKKGILLTVLSCALAAAILTMAAVLFFRSPVLAAQPEEELSPVSVSSKEESSLPEIVTEIFGYPVLYSMENLIKESSLVVLGKVSAVSEPFLIRGVGDTAYPAVHMDYTITIEETLRGEAAAEEITVRMLGDRTDPSIIYHDFASLKEGEEYLLFLWKPNCGGSFTTKGDYYYITGETEGVYEPAQAEAASSTSSADRLFISQFALDSQPEIMAAKTAAKARQEELEHGMLFLDDLREELKAAETEYPTEQVDHRAMAEEAYRANVKSGMITQEECDRYIKELDEYAEIVTE